MEETTIGSIFPTNVKVKNDCDDERRVVPVAALHMLLRPTTGWKSVDHQRRFELNSSVSNEPTLNLPTLNIHDVKQLRTASRNVIWPL